MNIESSIIRDVADFIRLRREFHQTPELAFSEHATSRRVAELLSSWGYRVDRLTETSVIAILENGTGRTLGLRADMDALPIHETSNLPFSSRQPGVMHACGHDGHTAILLAAAHHLSRTRNFQGRLILVFQPAEEIGAGAQSLIKAGLFDRYPMDAIYGLHNWPGVKPGQFAFVEGPAMAAIDQINVRIVGRGGHGAQPQSTVDPILAAGHFITAVQSIVSRNVDPREMAVVTVGAINGGDAPNVIPEDVLLKLSLRSFLPDVRDLVKTRLSDLAQTVSRAFGAQAVLDDLGGLPSVINSVPETRFARSLAEEMFGQSGTLPGFTAQTVSEDFAYYLHHRPGSFIFVGNGNSAPLHSPDYAFNDDIIEPGASLWVGLVERFLDRSTNAADTIKSPPS
jgi:hippurate hydrolase